MKILFTNTAPIIKYGIGQAFADMGHEVRFVFLDQEESLYPFIQEFWPDFVFTDGGINRMHKIFPLLEDLRIPHIYWGIEDPVSFQHLALPYAQRSRHVFTPCQESIYDYNRNGIEAHLLMFGCHPIFHRQASPNFQYNHDLIFIGNNYNYHPARSQGITNILSPLINHGYDIKFFGNEWWLDRSMEFSIQDQYYGGYIPNEDIPAACASARIILGLHSVDNSSTMMSMRTFEVLGSGGFYLTQWTPAIENYFINHHHLIWSKSPEETLDLVNFYMSRPEARQRISRQGQQEVYAKHNYHQRIEESILPLLHGRGTKTTVMTAGKKRIQVKYVRNTVNFKRRNG